MTNVDKVPAQHEDRVETFMLVIVSCSKVGDNSGVDNASYSELVFFASVRGGIFGSIPIIADMTTRTVHRADTPARRQSHLACCVTSLAPSF